MKKVTRLRQPEGGVDIFKKKPIPKKPTQPEGTGMVKKKKLVQRQPEGSGATKKKKLIQRQPEGSGATKKKKLIQRQPEGSGAKKKPVQRQPEGSGAPKKITGRFEFADTNRVKKTNGKKTNGAKSKTPTSFGQAFAQARKKLGPGKTFTYKGKKYTTNRADDKKKKNMVKLVKTAVKKGRAMRAAT